MTEAKSTQPQLPPRLTGETSMNVEYIREWLTDYKASFGVAIPSAGLPTSHVIGNVEWLLAENESLKTKLAAFEAALCEMQRIKCVYCGWKTEPMSEDNDRWEEMRRHIETCERRFSASGYSLYKMAISRAENAEAENESLKAKLKMAGICELAVDNPNLASYTKEWGGRAEKAEAERDKMLDLIRGMATVEETPAGPILRVLSVRVRSELGTCHNAAFQSIAAEINRKADALLPKEKP